MCRYLPEGTTLGDLGWAGTGSSTAFRVPVPAGLTSLGLTQP